MARTMFGTVWASPAEIAECQFLPVIGEEPIPFCAKRMDMPVEFVQFLISELQRRFNFEPTTAQIAQ